ncbi:MAG: cobalamin biosynthesis protein CobQ [Oscillospiraceae bacterium]|jgi:MinD-like ATPase involved in chromosome partitioning or flagellar assembly|nr:cobalamin biosynthesis protein CobQ [Oscillospiraceae bacterium]
MELSKITVITGHYGCGKTNLAVNLAVSLGKGGANGVVTVADLDIVNPYFRTADFAELFKANGIRLAVSDYAGSSLDIPALNINIKGLANACDYLIIDAGGDGEGAKALGRFAPDIAKIGYEMLYVVNFRRYLTRSAAEATALMRDIEAASGLSCSAIVNNSNLGGETTEADVAASIPFAEETARLTGLPLLSFPAKRYVKPIWEL